MSTGRKEPLQNHVEVNCFSCRRKPAAQVLLLEWDRIRFQLCLCPECTDLENEFLVRELLVDAPRKKHAVRT